MCQKSAMILPMKREDKKKRPKRQTKYYVCRKLKTEQNAPDIKREVNSDLHCNAKCKPINQ